MMTVVITWDGEKKGVFLEAKYPDEAVTRLVKLCPHLEDKHPTGHDYAGGKKA